MTNYEMKQGTFNIVRGKSFVDFMIKMGADANKAKHAEGTHWKIECYKMCDKTWRVIMTCKEWSEANQCQVYVEGEETCVDSPLFGGKAKVTVTCPDANTVKVCTKSEKYGYIETTEVFTEQGVTMCVKHERSGATHSEQWRRMISEEGSYRYVCNEGGEAYMKATHDGPLPKSFNDMVCGATVRLVHLGDDCWQFSEYMGGQDYTIKVKMDEECDYNFPGMERKMIMTRIAPGHVKCIMRAKNGNVEEWVRWIDHKGTMYWCGHDKKSGLKCKIVYEKFCCMEGSWKPVSLMGYEKLASAMGFDQKTAGDLSNDCDYTLRVKETGGCIQVHCNSKHTPYNLIYKLNEEFEFCMPGLKDPFKCIETACGNWYTMVQKNSKMTVKICTKVTNCFMICETSLVGTDVRAKAIYAKW